MGGLRGPPLGGRILRGVPGSFVPGLPSLYSDVVITSRRGHQRCCDVGRCQALWWQWRQFPLRVVFEPPLLFHLDLLLPGGLSKSQRGVSTSLVHSSLSFTTHLHGNWSQSVQWGSLLPYDVVILLFQTVDLQSFQEGGPGFLVVLPGSTPFGSLTASPMGLEGGLTQPLHIAGRGLCPREVCTVIQLFFLEDQFVVPPLRLDPLCIVIKVLEVVPVHLLKEIIQEDGVPQRVLLFYEMPPGSILLHVSSDGSGEGFSFLCGNVLRYGDVIQVCLVGILFPSLSSKICRVPRAKVTQLNWGSRGGSTQRGECSTSKSRLALFLLKSLSEMRLAPSNDLTLRVQSWSLFSLRRGSLTLGGEPSTTAYGSGPVLQLL